MTRIFANRTEAGKLLAKRLTTYAKRSDVLVLALPRGGVPVAFEVAKALNLPLDICLVRKLGLPGHQELAMGAIASGGIIVLNQDVLAWRSIPQQVIERVAAEEQKELERRDRLYRGEQPLPQIKDRTIILIDDGIATGSTLKAAIAAIKKQEPRRIVVAVPVAPPSTCHQLKAEVDEVICLSTPENMCSISLWYDDFSQTSDEEVRYLLALANRTTAISK